MRHLRRLCTSFHSKHCASFGKFIPTQNDHFELILYVMEARGLTVKDMESFFGPEPAVTEVLNRQRPLTLAMIRNLNVGLNLSGDILIQSYPLITVY